MTEQELQLEIEKREQWIESINSTIQYADGPAYYNDVRRVKDYQHEISQYQHKLKILRGEVEPPKQPTADELKATRDAVRATQAAEKARQERLAEDARKHAEQQQAAKSAAYVNRFKDKRVRVGASTRRFYLIECPYKEAQALKQEHEELRWDPFVKRWYASVFLFGNQQYSPCSELQQYLLEPAKSRLAEEWSTKIKFELENLVPNKRELTIRVHHTSTPKFWNK